jgi:hypothetical protein
MPFTVPVVLTVAMDALLLLQVPPLVASVKMRVEPLFKPLLPEIADTVGVAFTVIVLVTYAVQPPEPTVYVIIADPAFTPVTNPVAGLTVAFALLLVHTPPAVLLVSRMVLPVQTFELPAIGPTFNGGYTVNVTDTPDEHDAPLVT